MFPVFRNDSNHKIEQLTHEFPEKRCNLPLLLLV